MARPVKQGLDYFPLDVNLDDKMELLEAECGLTGFAIIIKLFQKIYREGYFINWNEDDQLLFARKINSELITVNSVINTAIKRGIFNKEMFEKYEILTSKGIQKRYFEICRQLKRKGVEIDKNYLLINNKNNNDIQKDNTDNNDNSVITKDNTDNNDKNTITEITVTDNVTVTDIYPSYHPSKNENSEETEINSEETTEETIINSEETGINSEFSTQKKRNEMKGKEMKSNQIYQENSEETEIKFSEDEKIRLDEIFEKAQVFLYDDNIKNGITTAITSLFADSNTREKISNIRLHHIDFALKKFSEANNETRITFPNAYFRKCLLSALDDADLSNFTEE